MLVSGGYFTILASNTGLIKSGGESIQAQYFAQLEADTIKMLPYDEVDDLIQDTWQDFDIDQRWQYKVNIGPEENIEDSDNTMKIASIAVKKYDDTMSRYSLEVPLSSQGNNLPIGSIIAWPSNTPPYSRSWLECNGQSFDTEKYKSLAKIFPDGILPDLRKKFLEGNDLAGSNISPGLPGWYHWSGNHLTYNNNIGVYGSMAFFGGGGMMQNPSMDHIQHIEDIVIGGYQFSPSHNYLTTNSFNIPITVSGNISNEGISQHITLNGTIPVTIAKRTLGIWQDLVTPTTIRANAFYGGYDTRNPNGDYGGQYFPPFSYYKGQHLYGASDTVQPNSFTVKFYIKAH